MDFSKTLIGLHGLSVDPTQASGFKYYHFRRGIGSIRGVSRLGTGVALMQGHTYPPLEILMGAQGFVDVRFAQWQVNQGHIMWTVPRTRGWVKGNVPEELKPYSLTETHLKNPPAALVREHWQLAGSKAPNDGLRYYEWKRLQKAAQA